MTQLSTDGRFVAFHSRASDLVVNDPNGSVADVFVRDMLVGVNELVSLNTSGAPANDHSFDGTLSADGRYVAFRSAATNLVPNDFNQCLDAFVRDRVAQTTVRVSVSSAGAESHYPPFCGFAYANAMVNGISISGDGRYVAFGSYADNLVPNDTNNRSDVFIHDLWTGTTEVVAQTPSGLPVTGTGFEPALSFDGRYVAFLSGASDLVGLTVPFSTGQILVCDRWTGICQLASVAANGQPGNGIACSLDGVSADGRYVTFTTDSDNLATPDTNAREDAFVRDIQLGITTRLSNTPLGGAPNDVSAWARFSDDGSLVVFSSAATDLLAGGVAGVTVIDRTIIAPPIATYCTGKTNSNGCVPQISQVGLPSISGKYAFFVSTTQVLNNRTGALVWSFGQAQTPFMGGTLCLAAPLRMTAPQPSHGSATGVNCGGWHSFQMTPPWMLARGWTAGTPVYGQYFCRDPAFAAPDQLAFSNALSFTVVP